MDNSIQSAGGAIGSALTRAKTGLDQLGQDLQPTLEQTSQQVGQAVENAKPVVKEVSENAKKGLLGAVTQAAKTAIWFQSFGASHSDSEGEGAPDSKAPGGSAASAAAAATEGPTAAATGPAA